MARSDTTSTATTAPAPDVEDVQGLDASALSDVALEVISLQKRCKDLDEQIKEKQLYVRVLLEEAHGSESSWSVRGPGWNCSYIAPAPRPSLDKVVLTEKLVARKVPLKVVEECILKATRYTPVTPYVSIKAAKEEE